MIRFLYQLCCKRMSTLTSIFAPGTETRGSYFTIKEAVGFFFPRLNSEHRVHSGPFRRVVTPPHLHPRSRPANKSARTNEKCYRCTSICLQSFYSLPFFSLFLSTLHPKKYLLKSIFFFYVDVWVLFPFPSLWMMINLRLTILWWSASTCKAVPPYAVNPWAHN